MIQTLKIIPLVNSAFSTFVLKSPQNSSVHYDFHHHLPSFAVTCVNKGQILSFFTLAGRAYERNRSLRIIKYTQLK